MKAAVMKAAVYRRYGGADVVSCEDVLTPEAGYPLSRISDAYRRVDAGHKQGNVVVTMAA